MDKLLVLGGVTPFCDLIADIKKNNAEVIVCDYLDDVPAKKMADYFYNVSTTDTEAIVEIAKKHGITAIIPAFSDRNLMPALEICRKLSLPCFYTQKQIERVTDKILMKETFLQSGFPVNKYKILGRDFKDAQLKDFEFPVVIKPVDSSGSKGIFVCQNPCDIRERFDTCTQNSSAHSEELIVEEFYPYDEVSISVWVKAGKAYITCSYDVYKNFGEHIILSGVVYPSRYHWNYLQEFERLSQRLVECFEIEEGPVTIQCFIGPKGLRVSEILYRLAGGSPYLYPVLLGGPNTANMFVRLCQKKEIPYDNLETFRFQENISVYDFNVSVSKPCIADYDFTEEDIKSRLKQCISVIFYRDRGEKIKAIPKRGEPVVRIICKAEYNGSEEYKDMLRIIMDHFRIYNEHHEDVTQYNVPEHPFRTACYPFTV